MVKFQHFIFYFTFCISLLLPGLVLAMPSTSWWLDEIASLPSVYVLDDDLGANDGLTNMALSSNSGQICNALNLQSNSTADYATLGAAAVDGLGDFTVSVWQRNSSTSTQQTLLSGANASQFNEMLMFFPTVTSFQAFAKGSPASAITIPSIANNLWTHFAWRRSGTQSCIFVNGVNEGCSTVSSAALSVSSLILGQEQDALGGGFAIAQDWEGLVDELLIFNDDLTDAEILSVYNNQNLGNNWDGSSRTCPVFVLNYSDWRFDEEINDGSTVIDSNGSNDGTSSSVVSSAGKICNGIDLSADGTSDFVTLGKDSVDGLFSFTVSVWSKSTSTGSAQALLSGANASQNNEMLMFFPTTIRFNAYVKGPAAANITIPSIANNIWTHFAWRRSGTQSCFFINGSSQGCATVSSAALNVESLILGQEQDNVGGGFDPGQDWEGLIDELLIFESDLSDAEILSIYNNQNVGNNWDGSARAACIPQLSVTKTVNVISDPVNLLLNPKMIPDAIIEYTIEASNTVSNTTAESVTVDDDLNTQITSGYVIWEDSITVTSPAINGGLPQSLTSAAGDDEGEFVGNVLSVECGDIVNLSSCVVKYLLRIN